MARRPELLLDCALSASVCRIATSALTVNSTIVVTKCIQRARAPATWPTTSVHIVTMPIAAARARASKTNMADWRASKLIVFG